MVKSSSGVRLARVLGASGVSDLSRAVTTDPYVCVTELVANAYDADANSCSIEYDPKKGDFSVVDDGSGMTPHDLVSFFRIGDSPKKTEPISPEGRRRIGKFGVATLIIPNMCDSYELVTRRNGLETTVREDFSRGLARSGNIPYSSSRVDKGEHGTELCMHGLKFGDWNDFLLRTLYGRLQWEFQLPPDFEIYLNNKPVEPKAIPHAKKFVVDERFGDGKIQGTVYLLTRSSPLNGIHVYVNGRRIGDPSSLVDYSGLAGAARGRILGILHANPLEEAILLDRSRFDRTNRRVLKFFEFVDRLNHKVAHAARRRSESRRKDVIEKNVPSALVRIADYLARSGVPEVGRDTEIIFSDKVSQGEIGRIDPQMRCIMLSSRQPALVVPPGTFRLPFVSRPHYEDAMLHAVVDTIALDRARRARKANSFSYFASQRDEIWGMLKNGS